LYDFNIEWKSGFSTRNVATVVDGFLHNFNLQAFFRGGSYNIIFYGTVTIKP
jgi:hypothetical protein